MRGSETLDEFDRVWNGLVHQFVWSVLNGVMTDESSWGLGLVFEMVAKQYIFGKMVRVLEETKVDGRRLTELRGRSGES